MSGWLHGWWVAAWMVGGCTDELLDGCLVMFAARDAKMGWTIETRSGFYMAGGAHSTLPRSAPPPRAHQYSPAFLTSSLSMLLSAVASAVRSKRGITGRLCTCTNCVYLHSSSYLWEGRGGG
eukprot:355172-Chlamydomonas_euryale.AAC.7